MAPQSFGIIGAGHFGRFFAESLTWPDRTVLVHDPDPARLAELGDGVEAVSLPEVAGADVVVVAVPFGAFADVLAQLRPLLPPETVVMDVVSVKARATALMDERLGAHPNIIASHPLFGPPSMARIEPGNRLVVTRQRGDQSKQLRAFLEDELGVVVLDRDPDEHDRVMAYMQALPFFIARALERLDLPDDIALAIPSFEKLAALEAIEAHHTQAMFDTSQHANRYASDVRKAFLDQLRELDAEIDASNPYT